MAPGTATDEWVDRLVGRPLARGVVRLLAPTSATANQVTVGAAVLGVGAGVGLALGLGWLFALLILGMMVLDCADGQLARLRGGGGVWGRLVDGIGDYASAIATHAGLIAILVRREGPMRGLLWGVGAGVSMAVSAYLLDAYKRRFRGDADDLAEIRREVGEASGLRRAFLSLFLRYARAAKGAARVPDLAAYRERLAPALTLWLMVGPTTHYAAWALCAAFDQPLLYAVLAVGPFNVLALAAFAAQRTLERRSPAVVGG